MAKKRIARQLLVSNVAQLTPNMRRVTLQGEDLANLPEDAEGGYFKLNFPGQEPDRPTLRTYTISKHRPELQEIDVDFMLHTSSDGSSSGVAAAWATQTRIGDKMAIFGPAPATYINDQADWFLMAADMTGLPALMANIPKLASDACGYIVIEIMSIEDQQELIIPTGMELIWVVNPEPGSDQSPLNHAIKELEWLEGKVAIWCACEFKTMRKNRQYFREDRSVDKSHVYISSYWKKGLQEEEHKIEKSKDAA
ncbi:MAG: siderophore-interacting protein [Granulosicoccus sp.]